MWHCVWSICISLSTDLSIVLLSLILIHLFIYLPAYSMRFLTLESQGMRVKQYCN
jgi:hypothetical protein